jgi:tryptophan synthase alpha chain
VIRYAAVKSSGRGRDFSRVCPLPDGRGSGVRTLHFQVCFNLSNFRIQYLFDRVRAEKRAALIAYLTAGDPSPARTPGFIAALERGGTDLIELGVPFSDPIADGPVIQRGSDRALKAGTNVTKVLEIACEIRKNSQIPLLLFTYLNPVLRYGLDRLARDAKAAGLDGCLLTDLSVEEAAPYVRAMGSAGLDTVFLAAPTSTPERLKLVADYSTGFVYLVSRTGVTGERAALADSLDPLIRKMRACTKLPLAVGFGISTPRQAAEVAKLADGVVVGSAFVRLIEQSADEKQLETFAHQLRQGMHT